MEILTHLICLCKLSVSLESSSFLSSAVGTASWLLGAFPCSSLGVCDLSLHTLFCLTSGILQCVLAFRLHFSH